MLEGNNFDEKIIHNYKHYLPDNILFVIIELLILRQCSSVKFSN